MKGLYYVLGLGQTGLSVVRYFQRHQQQCEVFDDKISPKCLEAFKVEFPDVPIHLHETAIPEDLSLVHELVISPGVPFDHPLAQKARQQNISIVGDIELFSRQSHVPVVGITGTNGKSTVTTLVGEMAKAAGLKVLVGGNIGEPVLEQGEGDFDWVILELSSFQLESTYTLHPEVACILNITPDHMDRYATFEDYAKAKHRIYEHASNVVMSLDDPLTKPLSHAYEKVIGFGVRESAHLDNAWNIQTDNGINYLSYGTERWFDVNALKIKGTHNWSNALAALAIGKCMGLKPAVMGEVLRQFPGLDHRCQWVREVNQVGWYNDSKGTNVGATLSAIKGLGGAIEGKMVLLLGGQSKEADFSDLCEPLKEHVRCVILYGQDADQIESMLKDTVPIQRVKTFEKVVQQAQKEARPGDIVLLSPACASWDMFDNYVHRGKVFTELVKKLR